MKTSMTNDADNHSHLVGDETNTANKVTKAIAQRYGAQSPRYCADDGLALLDGSLVSFECKRFEVHEGGDHFLLVGEVVRAQFEPRRDPLLYFRGKYRRLHFA